MYYYHAGHEVTIEDCNRKVEDLTESFKVAGFNKVENYASCPEHLCYGPLTVGANKVFFNVFISVLLLLFSHNVF